MENTQTPETFSHLMGNFDKMVEMLKSDPEGLEKLFREEIERVIENSHSDRKVDLERMQVQLDRIRNEYDDDPATRMDKMFSLMMTKMGQQNDVLQNGKDSETFKEMNADHDLEEFDPDSHH